MRKSEIVPNTRNLIFYNDAFLKIDFVAKTIKSFNIPVVYLDFDLLFSGYFESGQINELSNIEIIRPNPNTLKSILPNIITKISSQEIVLILDSLNGLQSFFQNENPARFINSLIMLLSANQKFSQSTLIVTCLKKGSRAEKAGIKLYDEIINIDGKDIKNTPSLNFSENSKKLFLELTFHIIVIMIPRWSSMKNL